MTQDIKFPLMVIIYAQIFQPLFKLKLHLLHVTVYLLQTAIFCQTHESVAPKYVWLALSFSFLTLQNAGTIRHSKTWYIACSCTLMWKENAMNIKDTESKIIAKKLRCFFLWRFIEVSLSMSKYLKELFSPPSLFYFKFLRFLLFEQCLTICAASALQAISCGCSALYFSSGITGSNFSHFNLCCCISIAEM